MPVRLRVIALLGLCAFMLAPSSPLARGIAGAGGAASGSPPPPRAVAEGAGPAPTREQPPATGSRRTLEFEAVPDAQRFTAVVRSLGGTVTVQAGDRWQVAVPAAQADALRARTDLGRLATSAVAVPLGIEDVGLGGVILGADRWQAAGFTGAGVKVAVLDTGFAGVASARGVSLPNTVITRSFRADRDIEAGTDHGLRAARILARIAPGAQIYLVNFSTTTELAAAVDYLAAEGVRIVSFSVGFIHDGPGDGTGSVNGIVTRASDAGMVWVSAAGNWAQEHWSGNFQDRNRDGVHEFASGVRQDERTYRAGDLIVVSLRWDAPWGAACSDYDLELYGPDGALVRAARGVQDCHSDPVESLEVLATRDGTYGVRIIRAAGERNHRLDLLMLGVPDRGERLTFTSTDGSLAEPADNRSALTVGAVDANASPLQTAAYSSRGPTADGRLKPDLVAASGEQAQPGDLVFAGTSAATPHVAGMLALLAEAFPGASRNALLREARARALELTTDRSAGVVPPRLAQLGSLDGVGPVLPYNADVAQLAGVLPDGRGFALLRYTGPNGYPLRFAYRLLDGRTPTAFYRFSFTQARWLRFISNAASFVNTFDTARDGDVIVARFD